VLQFPKRKDAEKAIAQIRVDVNEGAEFAPMNLEQLIAHYKSNELPSKAFSTREGYTDFMDNHIAPRWAKHTLASVKSVEVEKWLGGVTRKDGKPASPAMKSKIRNIMSALFAHAIRHGWAVTNPITAVRTSAKRLRTPEILTPKELQDLLLELPQQVRTMVLLDASTGLRRGELLALRWQDVNLETNEANVIRSIWRNVVGDTKTEASRKPVALHPMVAAELKQWKSVSMYNSEDDFLFPSIQKNGTQPVQPDMVLRRHIRPALERLGIKKRVGWHTFRHGLGTMLRQVGVDVKTAQELLRHANSRITLDFYQQAVTEEKREAQSLAVKELFGKGFVSAPSGTQNEEQKEEVMPSSA
jgi:integrase